MPAPNSTTDGGTRFDLTVTIQTTTTLDTSGGRVHHSTGRTDDDRVDVFALADTDATPALEGDHSYDVRNALVIERPEPIPVEEAWCPRCDGPLRDGCSADAVASVIATAVLDTDVEGGFVVLDDRSTVSQHGTDSGIVDDWEPMQPNREPQSPGFVCLDCGGEFERYEVPRAGSDPDATHAPGEEQMLESRAPANHSMANAAPPADETMGLAAGGAKDVGNFRENVENGFTPEPEAISDEGLFYDYHFDTGTRSADATDALFSPRYATAASTHPLTDDAETYVSVGLDSTLSMTDFERPRLDLVAVLDVSGSMSSEFDAYYYDEHDRKRTVEDAGSKLDAATSALCALTEQLDAADRLGVVLYNSRAHLAKPLRDVGSTDMDAIRSHIREVEAGGGTNLEDGFEAAVDLLQDEPDDAETERRVVFMTDMMPNTGQTGEQALVDRFERAASHGIHTTFLGMGLDENAALADAVSSVRGANHYFVHSTAEFERRLGDEFDYMVTPLVYDLTLDLDVDADAVAAIHGAPDADPEDGRLLDVGTLFPAAKSDGEARGGVILVRLESDVESLDLVASWTGRDGTDHSEPTNIDLPTESPQYDHTGIRKAIALARYARELRAWASDVHRQAGNDGVDDWVIPEARDEHERESVPLHVSTAHAARFADLQACLETEQAAVEDPELQQERELLGTLREAAPGAHADAEVDE